MAGERREIPFERLLLDQDNPRLLRHQESQRDAIHAMLRRHGDDVLGLARHIVEYGRDPSDLMKVVPDPDDDEFFIVVDGNRRLTAYRVLETPALLPDTLSKTLRKNFKELADKFDAPPETELSVVYKDREEAYPFIEIAHRGKLGGAGRASWSGHAGARFDELTGKDVPHLALLRFVADAGTLSAAAQANLDDFPITTLERVIETPEVADVVGFRMEGNRLYSRFPAREFLKGATKIVEDLATGAKNSRSLNSHKARAAYAQGLDSEFRPNPRKALKQPLPLQELDGASETNTKKPDRPERPPAPRTRLVPANVSISIANSRLAALFAEMKKVNVSTLTNAAAVLLRVFAEWSVEEYIRRHNVHMSSSAKFDKQGRRLLAVVEDMRTKRYASGAELKAISVAASNENHLINIETLHGYVHNTTFLPSARDVRDSWDQLEGFLVLLHSSYHDKDK